MASIFDMPRSSEKAVVVRILTNVHAAIDRHLPENQNKSGRFSDTLFDSHEQTKIVMSPDFEQSGPNLAEEQQIEPTRQNQKNSSPDFKMVLIAVLMLIVAVLIAYLI